MKRILLLLLCIPLFSKGQIITTFAGTGTALFSGDGGPATAAEINRPYELYLDSTGNLYFPDYNNDRVRKVNSAGIISTIAGTGTIGYTGDGGPATLAQLNYPTCVAAGIGGDLIIVDYYNSRIRKINSAGTISLVAGTGIFGYSGDGGPATTAGLNRPTGAFEDASGNLYIADYVNDRIRKVDVSGTITTIGGTGVAGYSGDGGPATDAKIDWPNSIILDHSGNIYFTESHNHVVRKINTEGIISTIAGTGVSGFSGDGGPATAANLWLPLQIAFDWAGNLYVADDFNYRVRKINPAGIISTVAGTGIAGYSGDGGPATAAQLNLVFGVAVDCAGGLYISDAANNRIRFVNAPPLVPIAGASSFCIGDSSLYTEATGDGYWSSSNPLVAAISSTTGTVHGVASGSVTLTYSRGCATVVKTITINPSPVISVTPSVATKCPDSLLQLHATGATTYTWYPPAGLSCTICPDPVASGTTSVTYTLIGTNATGCTDTLLKDVSVIPCHTGVGSTNIPQPGITLYPNPVINKLTISAQSGPIWSVMIIDPVGHIVFSQACNTLQETIDLHDLSPGLYFMRINGTELLKLVKK